MSKSNSTKSWHSHRPKNSLVGEGESNATPFTAIASMSSTPSTLGAAVEEQVAEMSAPTFPSSPVFPVAVAKHPDDTGLTTIQMDLHNLAFKDPPSRVVKRDPEAKPEGFYFEQWLDFEARKNINSK